MKLFRRDWVEVFVGGALVVILAGMVGLAIGLVLRVFDYQHQLAACRAKGGALVELSRGTHYCIKVDGLL